MPEEINKKGGLKVCDSFASQTRRTVQVALNEFGKVPPEVVSILRTGARFDADAHRADQLSKSRR